MKWFPIVAVALVTVFSTGSQVARAQVVRSFGGGSVNVRAPFVRVYVGPNGETSVRAPFVAIDTPGRGYYAPYRVPSSPVYPGSPSSVLRSRPRASDPASLDWQALREMLRTGVDRLEGQLDRTATGERWKDYLRTALLRRQLLDDVNWPPDAETLEILQDTLPLYDSTSQAAQFRRIASLSGFGTVHAALRELVIGPLDRQKRQLTGSARELEQALSRLPTGPGWISHLHLADPFFFESSGDRGSEESLGEALAALARFDEVSQNPQYRAISGLPAFKSTHDRLSMYVSLLSQTPPDDLPDAGQVEVLPTPEPEPF